MDNHEIGILTFLVLGLALMFLPNALRFRRKNIHDETATMPKPKSWQLWLSVLAFLQAVAFVAIAFACEAAGTHWVVGALCLCASFVCSGIVLWLHGLRPKHFVQEYFGDSRSLHD